MKPPDSLPLPAQARFEPVSAPVRIGVTALTAFLTLIDLFAVQAILPALGPRFGVGPGAIGLAANACTLGMALASLGAGLLSARIGRRNSIALSLLLLAVPTSLLALATNIWVFAILRVAQGVFMAGAFVLMLAYLGEHYRDGKSAPVFSAFVAGNVLSNLAGRMFSASVADQFGLNAAFLAFAGLNLAGAALVYLTVARSAPDPAAMTPRGVGALARCLAEPRLRAAFMLGFLILFVFIGVFTYVNFVLSSPPFSVSMMRLGLVYLVFAPSLLTTLAAGRLAIAIGARAAAMLFLAIALAGLPLLVLSALPAVLIGLALVAIGTFGAQGVATGYVGRTASGDRGAASGLYLGAYFSGGLAGSLILGQSFEVYGWAGCVAGVALALLAAIVISTRLR